MFGYIISCHLNSSRYEATHKYFVILCSFPKGSDAVITAVICHGDGRVDYEWRAVIDPMYRLQIEYSCYDAYKEVSAFSIHKCTFRFRVLFYFKHIHRKHIHRKHERTPVL